MSIQKDLNKIFSPAEADKITEIYESLYYKELTEEYEAFFFAGDLTEGFFASVKNRVTTNYILQLEKPAEDYVTTMLVLKYLQAKSSEKTEKEFYQCIQTHDMKTLKRILKHNDPDGTYARRIKEIYT